MGFRRLQRCVNALFAAGLLVFLAPNMILAQTEEETADFTKCMRESVDKMPLRDLESVLRELASLRERYRHGEDVLFPRTILQLKSGKELSGFVVKVGEANQKQMVTFSVLPDNERYPEAALAYVPLSEISAVSMYQIDRVLKYISFTDPSFIDRSQPPTKLDIKRKLARSAAILSQSLGVPITADADFEAAGTSAPALKCLALVISDSTGEIVTMNESGSEQGHKLKFKKIRFIGASKLAVHRDGDSLNISAPCSDKDAQPYSRADLKLLLQKSL